MKPHLYKEAAEFSYVLQAYDKFMHDDKIDFNQDFVAHYEHAYHCQLLAYHYLFNENDEKERTIWNELALFTVTLSKWLKEIEFKRNVEQRKHTGDFKQLPPEILSRILAYLNVKDLFAFNHTNHYFHRLLKHFNIEQLLLNSDILLNNLTSLPGESILPFVMKYFRPTTSALYQQLKNKCESETSTDIDYLCYAMVTDNIHQLKWTKLYHAREYAQKHFLHNASYCLSMIFFLFANFWDGAYAELQEAKKNNPSKQFTYLNFAGVDFRTVHLFSDDRFVFAHCNFEGAKIDLSGKKLVNCTHANFTNALITHGNIDGTAIKNAIFKNTKLNHVTVHEWIANNQHFDGLELMVVILNKPHFEQAHFKEAHFDAVYIYGGSLKNTNFQGAKFQYVYM
ncbi:MAG: hypothetical protein JO149_03240, partial [Gammaproteobacteria bacterium]|nr:hypothetical protein [Gammaproteobacteria bacterium]